MVDLINNHLNQDTSQVSEEAYFFAFEYSYYSNLILSPNGQIQGANLKATQILGYEKTQLLGCDFFSFTFGEDKFLDEPFLFFISEHKGNLPIVEKRIVHSLGTSIWVKQSISVLKGQDGQVSMFFVNLENISFSKAKDELNLENEDIFTAMFHTNNAIKLLISPGDGVIVDVNESACDFYGYSRDKMLSMKITEINTLTQEQIKEEMQKAKKLNQTYFHFPHKLSSGEIRIVEVHSGPVKLKNHIFLFSIIHDITNQYRMEEKINVRIHHDVETGLPNKLFFIQALEKVIKKNHLDRLAVMWLDLDHFKKYKDNNPLSYAEELLRQVGQRLRSSFSEDILIAKMDKDEFALLIKKDISVSSLGDFIIKLKESFEAPFTIFESLVTIGASIGIAIYPEQGTDVSVLLDNSNVALFQAKLKGRGSFQAHDSSLTEELTRRIQLKTALKNLVPEDSMELFYQPVVEINKLRIKGVEALIRWTDPKMDEIPLAAWLDIAKEMHVWKQVFQWVLSKACAQFQLWKKQGHYINTINVNLTSADIEENSFIPVVTENIKKYSILPNYIEFDVPAYELQRLSPDGFKKLYELKDMGIAFNLDHFGIHSVDFDALQKFPLSNIKLDVSLLKSKHKENPSILKALLGMGRAMGSAVVVLGIEEPAQLKEMTELGFQFGQGFYFGKPISADNAFLHWKGSGLIL